EGEEISVKRMNKMEIDINQRKTEHIKLCLEDQVEGVNKTTGLEGISFIHNALPEIDFNKIDLSTLFLDKHVQAPFLVSSMTGGSDLAEKINMNLAIASEEKGWAIGLGSTRALLESDEHKESFLIVKECQQIVDKTGADSLVLHFNSLQEVVQDGGDLNFENILPMVEKVCKQLEVPVGVKEVGFGIDGTVAKKFHDAGVSFIDVAGAGGTSWSQVEKLRSKDPLRQRAAEAFNSWGNPTKDCLVSVRKNLPETTLVASGGMKTGLDAAKAITI